MGPCPMCEGPLVWRHNGVWCDRCHRKVETCCEGAPQAAGGPGACASGSRAAEPSVRAGAPPG